MCNVQTYCCMHILCSYTWSATTNVVDRARPKLGRHTVGICEVLFSLSSHHFGLRQCAHVSFFFCISWSLFLTQFLFLSQSNPRWSELSSSPLSGYIPTVQWHLLSCALSLVCVHARKKSTKINFVGSGDCRVGWGSSTRRAGGRKVRASLESLFSLGFEGENLGCPGSFAGISRTPGGVQKVCAKQTKVFCSAPALSIF